MEDKRNILREEEPFDYKLLKDNKAHVYYRHKRIKLLTGKDYQKLVKCIESGGAYEIQLFLAKITGNFKRGNEKKK